jgi:hypothetical protein
MESTRRFVAPSEKRADIHEAFLSSLALFSAGMFSKALGKKDRVSGL